MNITYNKRNTCPELRIEICRVVGFSYVIFTFCCAGAPGVERGEGQEAERGGGPAAGPELAGPDLEAPARAGDQMKSETLET